MTQEPDRITANLPSRDFDATERFYERLGFETEFKDPTWMILSRGPLEVEFFPWPDLDPYRSSASACVRVGDVDALFEAWAKAGLPGAGVPRLTPPADQPFGLRMAALVDEDGSLLRILGPVR